MKALQTRSPIHLYFNKTGMASVKLDIYVNNDPTAFDTTTVADYSLTSTAISEEVTIEVAELIRSKNQYLFNSDFYERRDTATYALIVATLRDDVNSELEKQYNFLRIRDGYVSRVEDTQLINNLVSEDFSDWTIIKANLIDNIADPFSGTDAVRLDNDPDGTSGILSFDITSTDVSSFFVIARSSNSLVTIGTLSESVSFSLLNENVTTKTKGVLATDILELTGDYYLISVAFNQIDTYIRISTDDAADSDINLLAPKIIKGNWLHTIPKDLILQDNTTIYSDSVIVPKISFDKKEANTTYFYENVGGIGAQLASDITLQSAKFDVSSNDLIYDQLDGTVTTQAITLSEICEPKYTPVKLSFINKYGVIQDLVFFKKRVDRVSTKEDKYKANILRNGGVLNHVGQKQIIRKSAMRRVKLNSGFYPESFNEVFEQLLNSLNYWIDDEPAVLTSSSWTEKTSVNDKLINYSFDFEYGNGDINDIR